jgi:hypothetical protein
MPRVRETHEDLYAHCVDPLCDGMAQEQVPGIRTTTVMTCRDLGGDSNLEERSAFQLRYINEADLACPHCAGPRDLTDQKRPQYAPLSGFSQDGLVKLIKAQQVVAAPAASVPVAGDELAAMRARLEQLESEIAQKANKPGPKPREAA